MTSPAFTPGMSWMSKWVATVNLLSHARSLGPNEPRCRFYGQSPRDGFRVRYGRSTMRCLAERSDRDGIRRAGRLARCEAFAETNRRQIGMGRAGVFTRAVPGSRDIRRHGGAGPLEAIAEMAEGPSRPGLDRPDRPAQ
jgi:hypothetical protein